MRGQRDLVVSQGWARRISQLVDEGALVTLPGAPHAVNYTTAEKFCDAVGPFLRHQLRLADQQQSLPI